MTTDRMDEPAADSLWAAPTRRRMDAPLVQSACRHPERWDVRHVDSTGSTNDDLTATLGLDRESGLEVRAWPAGRPSPVLITEEQIAGRGRSGRQWVCPLGAGLMFSVALHLPAIPPARRGWVGAILGVAIVRALRSPALPAVAAGSAGPAEGARMSLKWPNDLLADGLKCGGILAEMTNDAVVVGAGLNISLTSAELPRPDATSLLLAGHPSVDRNVLLAAILDEFGNSLDAWCAAAGNVQVSGLRAEYLQECSTVGSRVRVQLPGGRVVIGTAVDVDVDGAIVVETASGGRTRFSAGDVVHLRPDPSAGAG